jgi:anionic cell wall polymer biosynthesis LytR-Cps2A-Psr (LCP) family protein
VNPQAPLVDRHLHLRMPAGPQHINGESANGYVRTRFDTDYARAARQQEVLLQIVQRLVDPATEVDVPQLLDGLHSFETDLSLSDMPTFIELARRAQDAQVTDQVFNPEDGFIVDEGDFGDGRGYILIPDIEKMRRFAERHLTD